MDGGGDGGHHLTPDEIGEGLTLEDIDAHGDPSQREYVSSENVPATSESVSDGTTKIMERWIDAFGNYVRVHGFRYADVSVSGVKLK